VPHLIPLNETVDSLGAGDSFIGRLLLEILDRTGQRHKALTQDDILKLEDNIRTRQPSGGRNRAAPRALLG